MGKTLIVSLCVKGLRSEDPRVLRQSLRRVQSFIFCDYLADKFEQDDGVITLIGMLNEKMPAGAYRFPEFYLANNWEQ